MKTLFNGITELGTEFTEEFNFSVLSSRAILRRQSRRWQNVILSEQNESKNCRGIRHILFCLKTGKPVLRHPLRSLFKNSANSV
jgi:hypothetical protein